MRSPALLSTLSAAAALAALGAAATPAAAQVPPTLQLAGRLTDPAGTPLDGAYDVEVRLYGAVTGGTAVWTEPHDSVVADAGSIFLALGAEVPLSADVFDGSPRWLEIRIDGTALAPRLPVGSVPYAFRADVAAMIGDYAPEDLQPRIAAACAPGSSIRAIDDDGALTCEPDDVGAGDVTAVAAGAGLLGGGATGDVALAVDPAYVQRRVAGTCATGSSIRTIAADGTVTCETDDDSGTTYSGGAGIAVSGTTVSLSSAGCSAGEVWKWSGSAWTCEPDASASYTGGAGIAVSGTTVSLSSAGCSAGEVWKWSGAAWACEPDASASYTGGAGITVSGTAVSLSSAGCAAGEVWKWSGTAWACEPDASASYTGGAGITVSGTAVSLSSAGCSAGEVWKWSGTAWACEPDASASYTGGAGITVSGTAVSLSSAGCAAGEVWKWSGTAWACEPDASASYTGGAGITVSGTAVSLSSAGCAAGEVWKWSGTAWACEPDVDTNTTYTAGSGLTLGGTTLSTDNAVVARKDAAAGNQAFDGTTMVLDYTNNRVGIGTAAPRELLHVAGPAEIASLRLFRKYGNNGTVSCETYCRGGWDGGRSGICLAAKATEFVPDEPPRRIYVDCDVLPGLGTDPTCICGEVIE